MERREFNGRVAARGARAAASNKYAYPSDFPHSVSVCALALAQSIKRTAATIAVRMNIVLCV
jgi:hypothetical protein